MGNTCSFCQSSQESFPSSSSISTVLGSSMHSRKYGSDQGTRHSVQYSCRTRTKYSTISPCWTRIKGGTPTVRNASLGYECQGENSTLCPHTTIMNFKTIFVMIAAFSSSQQVASHAWALTTLSLRQFYLWSHNCAAMQVCTLSVTQDLCWYGTCSVWV